MINAFTLISFAIIFMAFPIYSVMGSERPHIIVIVADDLGFNDVGFHGSTQIPTPNIDALAYSGIILQNYYVQPICTPSRAALLTGKLPIHIGLQSMTIGGAEPYGLSLSEVLLSNYLADLGYRTHHVGKWHLGFFQKEYTPIFRGFESHFGYWTGCIDYYDHTTFQQPGFWGYDLRRNMSVARDCYGQYITDLLTDEAIKVIKEHVNSQPLFLYLAHLAVHNANSYAPLQAPEGIVEKFNYIDDKQRRKFAGMLWKLDESVGKIIEGLDAKRMLNNSIILFTTDNGGPAGGFDWNEASNWPLRGIKTTLWEGGVRGAGFLWTPTQQNPGRISQHMIHITDWLPTLYSAAGGDSKHLGTIDGIDQWHSLIYDKPSQRNDLLVNIDPLMGGAAIKVGDWKLVHHPHNGQSPKWSGWLGPTGRNETAPETQLKVIIQKVLNSSVAAAVKKMYPRAYENLEALRQSAEVHCEVFPKNTTLSCDSQEHPCLFDIANDPCEYYDVSELHPDIVNMTMMMLEKYNSTAVPLRNQPTDPAADPKYWNYAWTNWRDFFL